MPTATPPTASPSCSGDALDPRSFRRQHRTSPACPESRPRPIRHQRAIAASPRHPPPSLLAPHPAPSPPSFIPAPAPARSPVPHRRTLHPHAILLIRPTPSGPTRPPPAASEPRPSPLTHNACSPSPQTSSNPTPSAVPPTLPSLTPPPTALPPIRPTAIPGTETPITRINTLPRNGPL